jgi:hypothetical protein
MTTSHVPVLVRQPTVARLELTESGGKSAALFSLDFGDELPAAALVVLVAREQHVRIVEVYQHASGESEAPLIRGLAAYDKACQAIALAGHSITRHSLGGRSVSVCRCGARTLDGKATCGQVECGSSTGQVTP